MILMNDFKAEPEALRQAMKQAAGRVIDSGWYVLGKELESFEQKWAISCNIKHAVGVGNGMDAIEIALRSLNIGVGDEVITTSMTAFATVLAIIRSGATPVLADIDSGTALLSIESVERCLSSKTKAVVLVHLYGQIRGMQEWQDFCEGNHIELIEDCAQSHLAKWEGKVAGTFGKVGAYSFYPTKNLGALGDAGMLITQEEAIANKAQSLRNYGQSIRYHHPELGLNSRLDELQAAILNERMNWLNEFTSQRKKIAKKYYQSIDNPLINFLERSISEESHVYHLFVITTIHRDKLQAYLQDLQIQTLIHYPISLDQQPTCQTIKCDPSGLTNSYYHADTCLSLPCHPQMTDIDIAKVIDALNDFRV